MTTNNRDSLAARLGELMANVQPSVRLRAAMAAGTRPDLRFVETLVRQSATDSDFFVRDMLTWALTRHPADVVVPRLLDELRSSVPQARSQALHTLSKIGDRSVWHPIPLELLHDADADADDEVARSGWRAMVALLPPGEKGLAASELVLELGRGDQEMRRSLSRALVALGDVVEPWLVEARASRRATVRAHAEATERMLADPESESAQSLEIAKRVAIVGVVPAQENPPC